jgi:Uma2 family endonuclease
MRSFFPDGDRAMSAHALQTHRYTWSDYQSWPEDERWEIIDGVAYNMSPAPSTRHQTVTLKFAAKLEQKLSGKRCRPFVAPTDVKFSETDVVQPDILVVCDPSKITSSHIEGAPDLVVEVLSPSTLPKDLREKKALYQRGGVKEYLVIDPLENYAQRYLLDENGRYGEAQVFGAQDRLAVAVLEEVEIALWEVFELPAPGDTPPSRGPEWYRD